MAQNDTATILDDIYRRLAAHFGPTGWWPAESPFEVAVGAILTQNAAWVNVEKAIANLKAGGWLSPAALVALSEERLHEAIRPSGYFRVKAKRLLHFCQYLIEGHGGSMAAMAKTPTSQLRTELLGVNGIGPETADCILLYACGHPVFVIDAYTRRVVGRHGLTDPDAPYEALRAFFEAHVPRDRHRWGEYHALLVYAGKDFCGPRPRCEHCPLAPLLNQNGPLPYP